MDEEKEVFHTTTTVWTDNIEGVIKNISETCKENKTSNLKISKNLHLRYNIIMYSLIFIGFLTGTVSKFLQPEDADAVITVFSFLSSMLSAILKFSKWENKSNTYKSFASKYGSLESNINRQLSLDRKDRVNCGKYLEWVSLSYDELFASAPIIPQTTPQLHQKIEPPPQVTIEILNKNANDQSVIDLNRYSDGKMKYEMSRMYNHT